MGCIDCCMYMYTYILLKFFYHLEKKFDPDRKNWTNLMVEMHVECTCTTLSIDEADFIFVYCDNEIFIRYV